VCLYKKIYPFSGLCRQKLISLFSIFALCGFYYAAKISTICNNDSNMAVLRYHWPEDEMNPDGSLKESGSRMVGAGDTLYMSDQLGLHKVRESLIAIR
jgi:hypothetical protein